MSYSDDYEQRQNAYDREDEDESFAVYERSPTDRQQNFHQPEFAQVNAVAGGQPNSKAACCQMMLHGSCVKGNQCMYSHDPIVMGPALETLFQQLSEKRRRDGLTSGTMNTSGANGGGGVVAAVRNQYPHNPTTNQYRNPVVHQSGNYRSSAHHFHIEHTAAEAAVMIAAINESAWRS